MNRLTANSAAAIMIRSRNRSSSAADLHGMAQQLRIVHADIIAGDQQQGGEEQRAQGDRASGAQSICCSSAAMPAAVAR